MTRKILHLDLDAFFCAVEELNNPALKNKPFAVGGSAEERGVVASCSYPARMRGVRSAMPTFQALRLCPDLIVVDKHFGDYQAASRQVMAVLHDLTPLVEQLSIDEAFLDASDLPDPAEVIARHLQARINTELHLPCSLGVASNKLLAKIANNIGKGRVKTGTYPNTITQIPAGAEAEFLAPLATIELWGVGPKTAERLAQMGIHTLGELAQRTPHEMSRQFGKLGEEMVHHARGIDNRPIVTEYETKSISRETTFIHDETSPIILDNTLRELVDGVAKALEKEGLSGSTIKIKLRWSDFTVITRQVTLPHPTDSQETIYRYAAHLLAQHRAPDQALRLLGVGVSELKDHPPRQLGLWEAGKSIHNREGTL